MPVRAAIDTLGPSKTLEVMYKSHGDDPFYQVIGYAVSQVFFSKTTLLLFFREFAF